MHPLASKLAEDTNLSHYQAVYDADNKKVKAPILECQDLTPPIRKHTFAPEVEPSDLIDDDAEFQALSGIYWSSPNFQTTEEDKEPEKDDPEA